MKKLLLIVGLILCAHCWCEETTSITEFTLKDGSTLIAKRFIASSNKGETVYMVTLLDGKTVQIEGADVETKNTKRIALGNLPENQAKILSLEQDQAKANVAESVKTAQSDALRKIEITRAASIQYEASKALDKVKAVLNGIQSSYNVAQQCLADTPTQIVALKRERNASIAEVRGGAKNRAEQIATINAQYNANIEAAQTRLTQAQNSLPDLETQLAEAKNQVKLAEDKYAAVQLAYKASFVAEAERAKFIEANKASATKVAIEKEGQALGVGVNAELLATHFPRRISDMQMALRTLAPRKDDSVQDEYIKRLKQYRYICGVPYEGLSSDEEYTKLAYYAALICNKLGKLSHHPEQPVGMENAAFALAKRGAGESNLYGASGANVEKYLTATHSVDAWMEDSDASNIDRVGHRRWCINPTMLKSGFGASGGFTAMYAFDKSNEGAPDWDFIAYPAKGYMPTQFFGSRYAWSVSPNKDKFAIPSEDQVKVTLSIANAKFEPIEPLKLDYFHVEMSGFGSGPAIIFRPVALTMSGTYVVDIKGLTNKAGQPASINYIVHFVSVQ